MQRKEDTMKKGYWVVSYRSISDESAAKAYGALAVPAVESFGGRFLTRSISQVQPHEAGLQLRTVLVEFDSYEIAVDSHESEAYRKALQALIIERQTSEAIPQSGIRGYATDLQSPLLINCE
jgi:uncharacterized protein (DUF1330 family)